ncbi:Signal transduction histidine kinase [Sanguibacter gelidistatuariae]|uniref:histidine kinase n=1 Tax=Sanguibacter gelidistatuariae TaxID=1814289 RepID=A0A1G6MQZ9_9MICO|nr:HAMP domain-containing sensor histidine kinase [Sanguibacter gelidistatuariae]SDC57416.1 Signal transduction histidine kinase [Sanguibacter gelidistatuariae]
MTRGWPSGRAPRSLRGRIIVATAAATVLGMAALVAVLGLVLRTVVSNDVDGVLRDRAAAVATMVERDGVVEQDSAGGSASQPVGDLVWVYDATGALIGGAEASGTLGQEVDLLSTTGAQVLVEVDDWRLLAEPIDLGGGETGVVVVGVGLEPYENTQHTALAISAALGLVIVAGVTALAAWSVGSALRPVATMARRAAEWSEEDLSRRFALGPPHDEITELGEVLDALLERVSRVIGAEQRLTSELAHELRTPLTVVRGEAELALLAPDPPLLARDRERFERIVAAADQMTQVIETLLSIARGEVAENVMAGVEEVLDAAAANLGAGAPLKSLVTGGETGLLVAVPVGIAARALAPVLDNALRHARSQVSVTVRVRGQLVEIAVSDDGDGLGGADPELIFHAGVRDVASSGAGLGLSLARRVARAAGGDVRILPGEPTTFVVTFPLAS